MKIGPFHDHFNLDRTVLSLDCDDLEFDLCHGIGVNSCSEVGCDEPVISQRTLQSTDKIHAAGSKYDYLYLIIFRLYIS